MLNSPKLKAYNSHPPNNLNINDTYSLWSDKELRSVYDLASLLDQFSETPDFNIENIDLKNLSDNFLEESLWSSLQMHGWREQAEKILQQPEYIVMLILCLLALITNIMSIVAVCHVRHSLTNHLKLIINLNVSDILIVLCVLTNIANKIFSSPMNISFDEHNSRTTHACILACINSINIMSFLIALLTLLAMAIDHYVAIMNPLGYPRVMSKRNGYILITTMWLVAAIGGFTNFVFGVTAFYNQMLFNYCEYIMYDSYHAEFLIFGVTLICLFVITFIYVRIFIEVKRIQARMPSVPSFTLHNKKALFTTLVIIATFIICWLPYCLFQITMIIETHVHNKVIYKLFNTFLLTSKYLYILQLTNCLLDPIIYAVRLKIVKTGYKHFLRKIRDKTYWVGACLKRKRRFQHRRSSIVPRTVRSELKLNDSEKDQSVHVLFRQHLQHNGFNKFQDESDVNDNEIIPIVAMVTVHVAEDNVNVPGNIDDVSHLHSAFYVTDAEECALIHSQSESKL